MSKKIYFLTVLFCISLSCFSQFEVSFIYNKKEYFAGKGSIVLDSANQSYELNDWLGLYYSGDYLIIPISPGDEKTFFHLVKMNEEEKRKYYEKSEKPQPTLDYSIGEKMFSITGLDMNDKEVDSKKLTSKILVINFWFINCLSCVAEIPLLNKLATNYSSDSSIVFIAIALDKKPKLESFLKTNPFNYRIIYDGERLVDENNVWGFPTNLIVNQKGKIAFSTWRSGPVVDYWMRKTIEKLKK